MAEATAASKTRFRKFPARSTAPAEPTKTRSSGCFPSQRSRRRGVKNSGNGTDRRSCDFGVTQVINPRGSETASAISTLRREISTRSAFNAAISPQRTPVYARNNTISALCPHRSATCASCSWVKYPRRVFTIRGRRTSSEGFRTSRPSRTASVENAREHKMLLPHH